MTCIVGVTDGKTIWIGGDSAGTGGTSQIIRADQKVFVKDEFLFGFTTSYRMGQILRYDFTPPPIDHEDLMHYMVHTFVRAVRKLFKKNGYRGKPEDGDTSDYGGTFMVGVRGRIFTVDSDYQVSESVAPFHAAGDGESYALGALHALHGTVPEQKLVLRTLEIAELLCTTVAGPFMLVALGAEPAA